MEFLLGRQPIEFKPEHLPLLVSGRDKSGASFFSVSLVSTLFRAGEKALFFSLKQPAVDEFQKQCAGPEEQIFCVQDMEKISELSQYRAVVVKSGDSEMCSDLITSLPDISERVIFIKNFEATLNPVLWDLLADNNKVILSGDIDLSRLMPEIIRKKYSTKILFSQPDADLGISLPELPRYSGYMIGKAGKGIISIEM